MSIDVLSGDAIRFWAAHAAGNLIGLSTSGTTGRTKVIVRTTASWVDSFPAIARRMGLTGDERWWIPGPMSATMNLFAACLAQFCGATIVTHPEDASHSTLTPAALSRLVTSGSAPLHVLVAGDGLSVRARDDAIAHGFTIDHYYGAAEMSLVAWGTCSEDLRLFEDVEAEVHNNEIWVRSPWLARGYLHDGDTLRVREDGFVTVGDRGLLVGDQLRVWGRAGAITTGGATVQLAEIQSRLAERARGDVVVVGLPHPSLGHVVAAALTDPRDVEELRAWSRAHLTATQQPRKWAVVASLPLTPAGKVDVAALVSALR